MSNRTLTEAYAANEAYCAAHGHSWIGAPGSLNKHCSWCNVSELVLAARQEREAGERAKAFVQGKRPTMREE